MPSTRKNYIKTFRALDLFDRPISLVDIMLALESIQTPNTKRKHTIALRSMLGGTDLDITKLTIGESISRQYYLPSKEEYEFYRATFKYPERLDLAYYAGLRLGESVMPQQLTGNILTVTRQLTVDGIGPAKTKGPVIIPQWLAKVYPSFPDWNDDPNKLSTAVNYHSKKTGIPLVFHGLRAAYATKLVNLGANPEFLRRQLRHKNVSTSLMHYYQIKLHEFDTLIEDL